MSDKPYGKRPNSTGNRGGAGNPHSPSGSRPGGKGPRTGPAGGSGYYKKQGDGAGGYQQRSGPSGGSGFKKQYDRAEGSQRTGSSDRPYYKKSEDGAGGFQQRSGPSDRPYYKKQGDGAGGFQQRSGPSDRPYYKKQGDGAGGYQQRSGPSGDSGFKKQYDRTDGSQRSGPSDRPYYKKQGDGAGGYQQRSGPSGDSGFKKQYDRTEGFQRSGPSDRPYYKKQGDGAGGYQQRSGPSGDSGFKKQYDRTEGFQRSGPSDRPYYKKSEDGAGGFQQRSGPSGGSGFKKQYDRTEGSQRTGADRREGKPWEKKPFPTKNAQGESQVPVQAAPFQEDELPYLVMGRNAVREAIRSGRSIDRIYVNAEQDGSLRELLGLARDRNLIIREVDKRKLDEMTLPFGHGGKPANHQGIVAQTPGVEYCDVGDILDVAKERGESPFVILLDGVEDPHNLGSIIRSAECAGAHGVIIPKRRSASVTAAAVKASAGAVEYMKVARVSNIVNAIERLKQENVWIAGAHLQGTPVGKADLRGALALVIGGEGEGLSRLVREKCDFLVSLPVKGQIESLNASVAAAVLMYAKIAQDAAKE
ncbi:MAG: 23S rRNA (guanosine(2251)-2'-O)-methyltransferase RlmB [Bacillota bacterium]